MKWKDWCIYYYILYINSFDVFGDTVNLASRMESNGIPGSIQCSYSFYNILCNTYMFSYRGKVEMKGKGLTDCYLLESKLKSPSRTILRSFSSQSAKNMSVSSSSSSIDTPYIYYELL